jgi:hypothetical protein
MIAYNPFDWYWFVGGDGASLYASARAAMVPASDPAYQAWAAGNAASRIDTMDNLVAVLRAANVPPYHKVRTFTIIARLTAANLIDAADTALTANKPLWRQFYTAGAIDADYKPARDFLASIGADVNVTLAPE